MPVASPSLGMRAELSARLGNSMQPQLLKLRNKRGQLDLDAGDLVTGILLREADEAPLADLNFVVTRLQAPTAGERLWRLDLSVAAVRDLAARLAQRPSNSPGRPPSTRTAYWTASFQDAAGNRWPMSYGKLTIALGASGA